jgi:hypothetical protein
MTEPLINRYDVTFRPADPIQGRPAIVLALSQGGVPASEESPVFFIQPTVEVTPEESELLAQFLSQYVAHFGVIMPGGPEPQES